MYRGAIRCIFSELIRQDRIQAIPPQDLSLESPKTKTLTAKLDELGLPDVLIVVAEPDANLALAARNLRSVDVRTVREIDPVSLIGSRNVLISTDALKAVEERLAA